MNDITYDEDADRCPICGAHAGYPCSFNRDEEEA